MLIIFVLRYLFVVVIILGATQAFLGFSGKAPIEVLS